MSGSDGKKFVWEVIDDLKDNDEIGLQGVDLFYFNEYGGKIYTKIESFYFFLY